MHANPVAFVTGSSRGIGKAAAIALAEKGFDLVISARTVKSGEQHHDIPVPGSLEETAAEIRKLGREVLMVPMDLLDEASMQQCWETVMEQWGRVDVLVNNAIYQGEGLLDRVRDLSMESMKTVFQGNLFSTVQLTQWAIEHMLQRGGGRIINMVSASAMLEPSRAVDDGGWSFQYSASKGALMKLAGILKVELADQPILAVNMEPGLVVTEMMKERGTDEEFARHWGGSPVTVPASVIAWLATSEEALEHCGETISAPRFALKKQIHPDWRPEKQEKA